MIQRRNPDNLGTVLHPKLTMYATKVFNRYVWIKEDQFKIDEHVYMHQGDDPKDATELRDIVSVTCSRALPDKMSPWQLVIIPSMKDKGASFFHAVVRIHHAIADGMSLIRVVLRDLMDPLSEGDRIRMNALPRFSSRMDDLIPKQTKVMKMILEGPLISLRRLIRSADNNSLHGQKLTGCKVISWSEHLDLNLVKSIKNATGTTVNDVLMSCLLSACRKHFQNYSFKIPATVLCCVPIDVRPLISTLTLDNQLSLIFCNMPVDEATPLDLLRKTKACTDALKWSPEAEINKWTMKCIMSILPEWLSKPLLDWYASKATMVVSNIPGPNRQLKVAGNTVEDIIFWPPARSNVGRYFAVHRILSQIEVMQVYFSLHKQYATSKSLFITRLVTELSLPNVKMKYTWF